MIPTFSKVSHNIEVFVAWQNNGSEVTSIGWGTVVNNTETTLHHLLNITNTGNQPVTLALSAVNQVNITSLVLAWNVTAPLLVSESVVAQLNQTVNASYETCGYDTKIDATG